LAGSDTKGGWNKKVAVERTGNVLLVFHIDRDKKEFYLSVVEDGTGIHEQFPLGKTDDRIDNPIDGSSFVPFARDGDKAGPVLFAGRIMLKGASQKRQYVVFTKDTSVFVTARQLGAQLWKKVLRLDFPAGTTFTGIGTVDPH
jgi:hypothetical protein